MYSCSRKSGLFVIGIFITGIIFMLCYFLIEHGVAPSEDGRKSHDAGVSASSKRVERLPDAGERLAHRLTAADSATLGLALHEQPRQQTVEQDVTAAEEFVLHFHNAGELALFVSEVKARGGVVLGTMERFHAVRVGAPDEVWLQRLIADTVLPVRRERNLRLRIPEPPFDDPMAALPVRYMGFGAATAAWLGAATVPPDFGGGVAIAVLDTGIAEHPSLAGRVRSMGPGRADATHGTAIASMIAGDAAGIQGLAPGATLLDFPVLDAINGGDQFSVAEAIVAAVDAGAAVINISAGGNAGNHVLADAVRYATSRGVVVVASAGNDGRAGLAYPAAFPEVLSVGAVDATMRHVHFSNRDETLDMAAPGVAVLAATPGQENALFSGTSGAAAWVSGAIAALMTEKGISATEAVARLLAYSNDTGEPGRDSLTGVGVLDLGRALDADTPGIVDAAVMTPSLAEDGIGNLLVGFGVQNRGTEQLAHVTLTVQVGETTESLSFYNLAVGASHGHQLRIPVDSLSEQTHIRGTVSVRGAEDMRPHNNAIAIVYGDSSP